jgi:replicative DNA helicase
MTTPGDPAAPPGGADDTRAELAELAEAALLGALLWDPRRLADLDWLDPTDFARPAYQAIYQTLIGLWHDGVPIDLLTLPDVLARGDYHDMHNTAATTGNGPLSAYALAQLICNTPASPAADCGVEVSGHSEHRRYAAIVLEESVRRHVAAAGSRIEQSGTQNDRADMDDALDAVHRAIAQAHAHLDALQQRITAAAPLPRSPGVALPSNVAARAATDRRATRDEYELLGACVTHPLLREQAQRRLLADDFATPEVAATWTALASLSAELGTVDAVLLASYVQRLGEHPEHGPGIRPRELAELARRSYTGYGHLALTEVTRSALARAASRAHQILSEIAINPRNTSQQALDAAREALEHLDHEHRRLSDTDTVAPSPSAPRPAPVPARAVTVATPRGSEASQAPTGHRTHPTAVVPIRRSSTFTLPRRTGQAR